MWCGVVWVYCGCGVARHVWWVGGWVGGWVSSPLLSEEAGPPTPRAQPQGFSQSMRSEREETRCGATLAVTLASGG
eukprot:12419942-Prorocentrum_lima.AAC.1